MYIKREIKIDKYKKLGAKYIYKKMVYDDDICIVVFVKPFSYAYKLGISIGDTISESITNSNVLRVKEKGFLTPIILKRENLVTIISKDIVYINNNLVIGKKLNNILKILMKILNDVENTDENIVWVTNDWFANCIKYSIKKRIGTVKCYRNF